MTATPRTIQIFLPISDPRGLRIAELTTSIACVFEVPRSQLADFLVMPEAQQVGVYYLVGEGKRAGERADVVIGMLVTVKANGHGPHASMTDVLTRLPMTKDCDIGTPLLHCWRSGG